MFSIRARGITVLRAFARFPPVRGCYGTPVSDAQLPQFQHLIERGFMGALRGVIGSRFTTGGFPYSLLSSRPLFQYEQLFLYHADCIKQLSPGKRPV